MNGIRRRSRVKGSLSGAPTEGEVARLTAKADLVVDQLEEVIGLMSEALRRAARDGE